jgi:hypothetical protein
MISRKSCMCSERMEGGRRSALSGCTQSMSGQAGPFEDYFTYELCTAERASMCFNDVLECSICFISCPTKIDKWCARVGHSNCLLFKSRRQ